MSLIRIDYNNLIGFSSIMADTFEVELRRMDTSQPWGFRLRGGTDQGMPLFVEHVCNTVILLFSC